MCRLALALLLCATACVDEDSVSLTQHGISGLEKQLNGHHDPIATWLRQQDQLDDMLLATDMPDLLLGLARNAGCEPNEPASLADAESIRTFVISDDLVPAAERGGDGTSFPRLIATVCSQSPKQARNAFVAASFKSPGKVDVDLRNLEMFGWDPQAKQYRFYKTTPLGDDLVSVTVEPEECAGCHRTPQGVSDRHMPMLPIMNELRQPWSHWQSASIFDELSFDPPHEFELPDGLEDAGGFHDVVGATQGAAANLEVIVEEAQKRVVSTRMQNRHRGEGLSDLDRLRHAMALLRPLFCDEQLNYVSEDHNTAFLRVDAVVDPALPNLFRKVLPPTEVTWQWATVSRFHLDAAEGPPVSLIPVRGNANVLLDRAMVSSPRNRAITPLNALRIRALDWETTALSSFRCDLFRRTEKRFARVANRPANLTASETVAEAAHEALNEILTLRRGGRSPGRLLEQTPAGHVVSLKKADEKTIDRLHQAIDQGTIATGEEACARDGFCFLPVHDWGDALEAHLSQVQKARNARDWLRHIRCERVAALLPRFANKPALPFDEVFPSGALACGDPVALEPIGAPAELDAP